MDVPTNGSRGLRSGGGSEGEAPIRIVRAGSSTDLKLVNLALQGGGAHGAFAWGVLDRGGVAMGSGGFRSRALARRAAEKASRRCIQSAARPAPLPLDEPPQK